MALLEHAVLMVGWGVLMEVVEERLREVWRFILPLPLLSCLRQVTPHHCFEESPEFPPLPVPVSPAVMVQLSPVPLLTLLIVPPVQWWWLSLTTTAVTST